MSKDPAKTKLYGTGGLGVLKAEMSGAKMSRGAVAAVLQPGKPDSAGSQFFVCVTDQPALDGKYTVFGHVSEGLDVVQKISETPATADGLATERVAITSVTIRDTPPAAPVPFAADTPEQLAQYRAVLDTSAGPITVELFGIKAPEHVRNFLRLASAGVYELTPEFVPLRDALLCLLWSHCSMMIKPRAICWVRMSAWFAAISSGTSFSLTPERVGTGLDDAIRAHATTYGCNNYAHNIGSVNTWSGAKLAR